MHVISFHSGASIPAVFPSQPTRIRQRQDRVGWEPAAMRRCARRFRIRGKSADWRKKLDTRFHSRQKSGSFRTRSTSARCAPRTHRSGRVAGSLYPRNSGRCRQTQCRRRGSRTQCPTSQDLSLHLQIQKRADARCLDAPTTRARQGYTGAMQTDHFCEASLRQSNPRKSNPLEVCGREFNGEARSESDHCGACFRWDFRHLGALAGAVAGGRGVATGGVFGFAGSGMVHARMLALVRNRDRTGLGFRRGGPLKS